MEVPTSLIEDEPLATGPGADAIARNDSNNKVSRMKANNQRVLPIGGVIIVLLTLYLSATVVRSNYNNYFLSSSKSISVAAMQQQATSSGIATTNTESNNNKNHEEQIKWRETYLEQQPTVCHVAEILTKDMQHIQHAVNKEDNQQAKPKISKRKSTNGNVIGVHGHKSHTNNKSTINVKNIKNAAAIVQKKKDATAKKTQTAEPIIYLFALVFIYLLVKAASDINQHYKSQNKSEKRLRRCSLQSYAQAHKQDRRASKDSITLRNKPRLLESRSISVDRYKHVITEETHGDTLERTAIMTNLRKYTSFDNATQQQQQQSVLSASYIQAAPTTPQISPMHIAMSAASDLSRPLIVDRRLGSPLLNRRCSVPVTINYQTLQMAGSPTRSLVRRTSIIGGSMAGLTADPMGSTESGLAMMEPKRRVRMINRH